MASEIRGIGTPVLVVPTHLGKSEDLDNLVTETQHDFGRIDILVNNAATNPVIALLIEIEE